MIDPTLFTPAVCARFWSKVNKTDTCWLWQAGARRGYGAFWLSGRQLGAHRIAYEMLIGPVPDDLHLDHLCRTPACVNPAHLEPVTCRENLLRSPVTLQGTNARKTYCDHGHEFTPENTYEWRGSRICRKCRTRRGSEYRSRYGRQGTAKNPRIPIPPKTQKTGT